MNPTSTPGGAEAGDVLRQEPEFGGGGPAGAGGQWGVKVPAPAEGVWGAGGRVGVSGVKLGYPAPSSAHPLVRSKARTGPAGR